MYPQPIEGKTYLVGALRDRITWELWSVLALNGFLSAIMLGLSIWAKRAPLHAMIVAAAVYAVVVVGNAIAEPASIAQGMIMKILIVAVFVRGIKAALELRVQELELPR